MSNYKVSLENGCDVYISAVDWRIHNDFPDSDNSDFCVSWFCFYPSQYFIEAEPFCIFLLSDIESVVCEDHEVYSREVYCR